MNRQVWVNFLALLPSTALTVLVISVAFLRFYDERDFEFLGIIAQPRAWSNRLTVAALLAALANFGVEWNRRNRETDRLAAEGERTARRTRVEARYRIAQIRFQLEPNEIHRRELMAVLAVLEEYGDTL